MSMSPHHRAISPPTPAPSPQPDLHSSLRHVNSSTSAAAAAATSVIDHDDPAQLLKHVSLVLPQYSQSARLRFISEFIDLLDMRELAHLSALVTPRLKVDFLSALPIEVSLNILSFIDDPKTLARASCVSRFWRSLVNDEHTWKVMCLKHKYRRRGSSGAALNLRDDRYLRSLRSNGLRSLARTSASSNVTPLSIPAQSTSSAALPAQVSSSASALDSMHSPEGDDAAVLASLYQRYRDRGLDPSNALHELRTLHDLFLSKQEGDVGSLTDQMSHTERAFYSQLEEIVDEENRARYGDETIFIGSEDDMLSVSTGAAAATETGPAPSSILSARFGATPLGSSSNTSEPPQPSNLGWLSAGPSASIQQQHSRTPASANLPFNAISGAYRTSEGRLDRLQGWQNTSLTSTSAPAAISAAVAATTSETRSEGGDGGVSDMAMDMDDHVEESEILAPIAAPAVAASATPILDADAEPGQPPNAPRLASLPHHVSPTSRFSGQTSSELGRRGEGSRARRDELTRGRLERRVGPFGRGEDEASTSIGGVRGARARNDSAAAAAAAAAEVEAKKARRSSAPLSDSTAPTLGHGFPYADNRLLDRSLTLGASSFGAGSSSSQAKLGKMPFSYRTHFKMAYLTESNWRKGGRLQTQHVSADAGHVVTSLAIDSEWIVVGMANSKIHVFSAETGLYAHTLLGHDSGVWCLTLISRTGRKREAWNQREPQTPQLGKGKMVITDPEDGSGGKPYRAAADGDLRLVHHDPRPDAADALFSPSANNIELDEEPVLPSISSSSTPSGKQKARQDDGHDETLEWFHKARRAMMRQQGTRRPRSTLLAAADGYGSGQNDSDADSSIRSDDHRSERIKAEKAKARDIAEAEAGAIRDAVMADGTGQVPANVAESIERNRRERGRDGPPSGAGATRSGAASPIAGNNLGLGNPCGSVMGYGNEDAIVVSGGCDRDVRVWDLRTGECKHVLHGHTSTVRCLKVLDGEPIAVSGSRDSTLRVWNVETGEHLHLLSGHQHSVRCIEVAGKKVASGSYDGTCRLWDLETGRCLHTLRGHIHYIYAVAFDGQKVATGSLDSTVRVWSAETGECLALFQGHTSLVGQLQLLDNTLVTGGSDGRVIVFSLKTYECLHRLCAHDNSVTCLQFDDRYIITGGNDGHVKLWDFNTGKFIREICEPCDQVWKVSYRDDKVVVLCKRGEKTCMDVITFRPAADEM
ncbi:WD40 repeat-like protein [Testicularia cyperi]|uniref:WD40 repeat-like protein n=1 Tax=Testicularia cyperi TaxID=1882483 RepID=A0A317Y0A6_9BASI|nr:WD40 repeat-like protein [Testicularia cyperi]